MEIKSIFGTEGSTIKIGKKALECYVLPGLEPILERRSFQKALGYDGRSTRWLYDFLVHLSRNMPISIDLLDAVQANRYFSVVSATGDFALKVAIEPSVALKACRIIAKANQAGLLYLSELKYAKAAEAILETLPESKIKDVILFTSGFERYKINVRERIVKILNAGQPESLSRWVMTIPDTFFESVFEFYAITWEEAAENADELAGFFRQFVFERIDDAMLDNLKVDKLKMSYRKPMSTEKYHEHPELAAYLRGLQTLMRLSNRHLAMLSPLAEKAYPTLRSLSGPAKKNPAVKPPDSFESILLKGLTRKS